MELYTHIDMVLKVITDCLCSINTGKTKKEENNMIIWENKAKKKVSLVKNQWSTNDWTDKVF